jgi:GH24 family phage-related lysozyme (muramidase)
MTERRPAALLRIAVAALTLSAAGFAGLAVDEGYTDRAVVPLPGDRPTVGLGSTWRDDGTPVQPGDTITPVAAIQRAVIHIGKDEARLRKCMAGALMTQGEWDVLVNHSFQYGSAKTCSSTVARLTREGRHAEACQAYLAWRFFQGRDCRDPASGCRGVWLRAQERAQRCAEAAP